MDIRYKYAQNPGPKELDTPEQKASRVHCMADLVYQLIQDKEPWDEEEQVLTKSVFDSRRKSKELELPTLATAPDSTPVWGPMDNETWGEPYDRAINAFQIMTTYVAGSHERKGREADEFLEPQPISPIDAPEFMKMNLQTQDSTVTMTVNVKEPMDVLQPKAIKVIHVISEEDQSRLEAENKDLMITTSLGAPDLRSMPGEEWRDAIRTIFNLETYGLQLQSMDLMYKEEDGNESIDLLGGDWTKAQELFQRLSQDQLSKIRFRTRPLGEGEVLRE